MSSTTQPASLSTKSLPTYGADPAVATFAGLQPVVAPVLDPGVQVLTVGAGKQYATLGAAVAAAGNGAVILVDAGTYTNDFATVRTKISIIGVGGMVNLVATIPPTNLKGILTVDNDLTIRNVSFSGAAIDDASGGNGAGIRYEGGVLVVQNCSFSNNQNGLMGSPVVGLPVNTITIDHSVFSGNGSGTGYTHNVYVGAVSQLTFTNNVSQGAVVGHELKSRALANTITGNVFRDGPTGSASYEIDLPNGGTDVIANNIIEKGPNAQNYSMVHFGGEGIPYAGSSLTVSNNTFVNDLGPQATGVLNQTAISASINGNIFTRINAGAIASGPAKETNNADGSGIALADTTLSGVLPGSTLIITDAADHTVTLNNSLLAVQGGSGHLNVYAAGGHVIAIGGSGGMNFSESATSGGNQITTASGSVNAIMLNGQDSLDSEGIDTIVTGGGNVGALIAGTATVWDGSGNNQYSVEGTAVITGHGANPVVSVGAKGSATINGDVGYLAVTNNGGAADIDVTQGGARETVSIRGGAVSMRMYGSQMAISTAAGPAGATLRFGAGTTTVFSAGSDAIYAGSGTATVIVGGAASVYAGTGPLSVFGRSSPGGASVYGNGGIVTLDGDTGNITYYGGATANTVVNKLSNDTLIGGAGRMTVVGGSRETIVGGSGGIDCSSPDGGGANSIVTAAGSTNILRLAGGNTVDSRGNDTIYGGQANSDFTLRGNAVLTGSTGNSRVAVLSGTTTLTGRGQDWVTVAAGAQATITAGVGEYVTNLGGVVRLNSGTASVTVSGGSAQLTATAGAPIGVETTGQAPTTVTAGSGAVNITSRGADLIQAGSGPDTVILTVANSQIRGGSGALTIHNYDWKAGDKVTITGGSGALNYDQSVGALTFIGGAGSAVINGGSGSLQVTGGTGALYINGGSGGLRFVGAMGATAGVAAISMTPSGGTVQFGQGRTTVQVASWGAGAEFDLLAGHGGGIDIINGFRVGTDHLHVGGGVAVTSTSVVKGSLSIKFNDNSQVQLTGVTKTTGLFI